MQWSNDTMEIGKYRFWRPFPPLKIDLSLHEFTSVSIPTLNLPLGPYKGAHSDPHLFSSLCAWVAVPCGRCFLCRDSSLSQSHMVSVS